MRNAFTDKKIVFLLMAVNCAVLLISGGYCLIKLYKRHQFFRPQETPSYYIPWENPTYPERHILFKLSRQKISGPVDVVFVGDSLIQRGEWGEWLNQLTVINQGIGSDTVYGVLQRTEDFVKISPRKLVFLIGINDIQQKIQVVNIAKFYAELIRKVRENSGDVEIAIISVLPAKVRNNEYIAPLNQKLQQLCIDNNCTYIDAYSKFMESLERDLYAPDQLHLSDKGYQIILECLSPFLNKK